MYNTAEIVKGAKNVKFVRFKNEELWYATDTGFEFPINTEERKGAIFLAEDRPAFFMRWIRKHVDWLNKCSKAHGTLISYDELPEHLKELVRKNTQLS